MQRRFSTAFDDDVIIRVLSLTSLIDCGEACRTYDECKGIFFWLLNGFEERCHLLNDLGDEEGIAASTLSVSYRRDGFDFIIPEEREDDLDITSVPMTIADYELVFRGELRVHQVKTMTF